MKVEKKTKKTTEHEPHYECFYSTLLTIFSVKFPMELQPKLVEMLRNALPNHPYAQTAFLVPTSFKILYPDANDFQMKQAHYVGLIFQLAQAAVLLMDDFVDGSEERYGTQTWTALNKHEHAVVNQIMLLNSTVEDLLEIFVEEKELCRDLSRMIREAKDNLLVGNLLEEEENRGITKNRGKTYCDNDEITRRLSTIAGLKTGSFHFALPLRLAMRLAKYTNKNLYTQAEIVGRNIGILCQLLDDYFDSFTKDKSSKKHGDITRGQFSWLYTQAFAYCEGKDRKTFVKHFGRNKRNGVKKVLKVLENISIHERFALETADKKLAVEIKIIEISVYDRQLGSCADFLLKKLLKVFKS